LARLASSKLPFKLSRQPEKLSVSFTAVAVESEISLPSLESTVPRDLILAMSRAIANAAKVTGKTTTAAVTAVKIIFEIMSANLMVGCVIEVRQPVSQPPSRKSPRAKLPRRAQ
jgi:hypothetical protein